MSAAVTPDAKIPALVDELRQLGVPIVLLRPVIAWFTRRGT